MPDGNVYLRPNILAEPLINQWYAWPYLIPPAASCMYLANSHLKIMQSFIAAPQVHVSALKNPAMVGGSFMNCDPKRVGEVQALLEEIRKEQRDLLKLAESIKSLDHMLVSEADGCSLEHFYPRIPDELKGFVELVYDMHNNPSFRFIEPLLYKSRYYDQSRQSVAFSLIFSDGRPFVFSTPRLQEPRSFHLKIPFGDEGLDELFRMKETPRPVDDIADRLGIDPDDATFGSFFTTEPNHADPVEELREVRVRYFGHACVLMETKSVSLLCDPVISYRYDSSVPRFTFDDLPKTIDYVLITHNHQDHCMFETLLQLRHKIGTILVPRSIGGSLIDPSLKLILQNVGFKNVREIEDLQTIEVDGGTITGIPFLGEHADMNIGSKIAYAVKLRSKSIVCLADSNNVDSTLYDHVRELIGKVDILFLGMECDGAPLTWLYGPLLTAPLARKADQSRRFDGSDCQKAMRIVKTLSPSQVYVYAMGQEPWLTFLTSIQYTSQSKPIVESDKLVEECTRLHIKSERLFGCRDLNFD
jgi:L-ascorbate metabolism protein UlaG (beta-lactamase superfamily)